MRKNIWSRRYQREGKRRKEKENSIVPELSPRNFLSIHWGFRVWPHKLNPVEYWPAITHPSESQPCNFKFRDHFPEPSIAGKREGQEGKTVYNCNKKELDFQVTRELMGYLWKEGLQAEAVSRQRSFQPSLSVPLSSTRVYPSEGNIPRRSVAWAAAFPASEMPLNPDCWS